MMPCVRYFICEDGDVRTHIFDISDIIPRTKLISKACSATKALESNKSFQPKRKRKKLSGMEWLMTCNDGIKIDEILDIPPVEIIENHFTSLVAWTFTFLLFLHIAYMGVFTFVGLEVQKRLHTDNSSTILTNLTFSESGILYFIVPLEPVIVFIDILLTFLSYCFNGDVKRRIQVGRSQNMSASLSLLRAYVLPLVYFCFAVLVIGWIVLLRLEHDMQDFILAIAVCM